MARLTEEQQRFLDNPYVAVATTLRPDGSPHSTVVWVDRDNGAVTFNTAYGRRKPEHIQNDNRVSLTMVDPEDPMRWISISGKARLVDEGADAHIDRLAKKYLGQDEYPWRSAEEQRVTVRIEPEKVTATGIE